MQELFRKIVWDENGKYEKYRSKKDDIFVKKVFTIQRIKVPMDPKCRKRPGKLFGPETAHTQTS